MLKKYHTEEEIKKANVRANAKWRAKNRDKVNAYNRKLHPKYKARRAATWTKKYTTNPEFRSSVLAAGKKWVSLNKDKMRARQKLWILRNPEKNAAQRRVYNFKRRWGPLWRAAMLACDLEKKIKKKGSI